MQVNSMDSMRFVVLVPGYILSIYIPRVDPLMFILFLEGDMIQFLFDIVKVGRLVGCGCSLLS